MTDAVLLAPIAVAVCLVVAGVVKLGSRAALATAFDELGVPAVLAGPTTVRALPWIEIVLAVGLLVLPAPAALPVAVLVVLLLLAYTVLLGRVVASGADVSCACFGGVSDARVGRVTLARNVVLLLAAVIALVDAARGHSPVERLLDLDGSGRWWLLGAAGVVLLAVLVGWRSPTETEGDPARRGIPYLLVAREDGSTVSLPELASLRAQLLVSLSTTCSRCAPVADVIGGWPDLVPGIDVRVLVPAGSEPHAWPPGAVHDVDGRVSEVLGLVRPSAVLLGADALVAGGPVHGTQSVLTFFEEVREALQER